jgi:hypothetical protein
MLEMKDRERYIAKWLLPQITDNGNCLSRKYNFRLMKYKNWPPCTHIPYICTNIKSAAAED